MFLDKVWTLKQKLELRKISISQLVNLTAYQYLEDFSNELGNYVNECGL